MAKLKKIIIMLVAVSIVVTSVLSNGSIAFANDTQITQKNEKGNQDKEEKLHKSDVPYIMDYDEAVGNKHIEREKDKENGLDEIVFKNQDGTYTTYIYDQNVKFVDDDGETKDIDVGIEKISSSIEGYTYTNGQNCVNVDFPDEINDGILVSDDENEIKMYPKDSVQSDINVENDTAVYEDAYGEGTRLVYTPTLTGVKEEIVLDKYNGKEVYTFIYEIGDAYITTLDDDCLYIYSSNDEYLGLIEPIYMLDASGKYNTNSEMLYYKNDDGTWTVEIIPDKEFLTSKDTVYPVIIDPTYSVNVSTNSSGIQDVTINSTSTSAGKSGSLFVGNRSNTENGISRVLMKIPSVTSGVCSSIEVQSATVTLRDVMCESTAMTIECRQFTGSSAWSESYASWNAFGGGYYGELYDSKTVSYSNGVSSSHMYSFDVTVAVKEWINDANKRGQGLVFKAANEGSVQNKTFGSYQRGSYQPTFTMTYKEDNKAAFSWSYLNNIQRVISAGMWSPNCAGFVLGLGSFIDSGTEGFNPNFTSINNFAYSFKSYVDNYVSKKKVVLIQTTGDWRKIALKENQYLIAARIGTSNNYHFKVQLNDGRWAEKNFTNKAEEPRYYNPSDNKEWNSVYTSITVYMVIQVGD